MDWFDFSLKLPITDPTWIFLLVLLIILFAPILLNKLRIPHIIGMILAGLVIGEHGFNILVRDSSFELFGKVGLYYIMFLAGLEMNMGDFKQNRGKALVLGLLAFIVPIGIGLVTNIALLKYGVLTSVLLASMYASHTLVAYPIVIRYGVSRHRSVSIAVGGTAVTDTLTLLVLAVVGGMFKGESDGFFWVWLVIKVIFLGILIVYLFPRIGRWFFRRYDDNVMQFIFVLAMVFLGAGLMEFVGMEGILGAFLAGLVLNRLIPHVSPLMNHGKHKYELHHVVIVPPEEPTAYAWKQIYNQNTQEDNLYDKPYPEEAVRLPLEHTTHNGQDQQSECIRNRRPPHCNTHTAMPRHTVTNHDGIGHQRM
jgi:Kef-type K+ transport system membrane component KefB